MMPIMKNQRRTEKPSVTWIRQNTLRIWDKWKEEDCPGTWPDYLADELAIDLEDEVNGDPLDARLRKHPHGRTMINEERDKIRTYLQTALQHMERAEIEGDDEKLLGVVKTIEHLANELRIHAEEHGL